MTKTTPATGPRALRADAARNRELVLKAAGELFAERGLEVSLEAIAAHAGLGIGTVYRRFENRDAIIQALFQDRLAATVALARSCLADEDPWRGLITLLRHGCEQVATDRGMRQVMLGNYRGAHPEAGRAELEPLAFALVERCHRAGVLRPGFAASDVPALFMMLGAIGDLAAHTERPNLWERYFDLLIDGIRPGDQVAAPALPPLSDDAMYAALTDWKASRP